MCKRWQNRDLVLWCSHSGSVQQASSLPPLPLFPILASEALDACLRTIRSCRWIFFYFGVDNTKWANIESPLSRKAFAEVCKLFTLFRGLDPFSENLAGLSSCIFEIVPKHPHNPPLTETKRLREHACLYFIEQDCVALSADHSDTSYIKRSSLPFLIRILWKRNRRQVVSVLLISVLL